MSEGTYRKAGRGGAGNYFSPKDAEESNEAALNVPLLVAWCDMQIRLLTYHQDIEAQTLTTPVEPKIVRRSLSEYAYSGRGGAGNWYSPKEVQQTSSAKSAASIATKSSPPAQNPFFGRGGAGNYNSQDSERDIQQQVVAAAKTRREEEVVTEVEMQLMPPARVYLSPERADTSV